MWLIVGQTYCEWVKKGFQITEFYVFLFFFCIYVFKKINKKEIV